MIRPASRQQYWVEQKSAMDEIVRVGMALPSATAVWETVAEYERDWSDR